MSESELERWAQRRLAVLCHVEDVLGNVAATCRSYGISRQCCYVWRHRFAAFASQGVVQFLRLPAVFFGGM